MEYKDRQTGEVKNCQDIMSELIALCQNGDEFEEYQDESGNYDINQFIKDYYEDEE